MLRRKYIKYSVVAVAVVLLATFLIMAKYGQDQDKFGRDRNLPYKIERVIDGDTFVASAIAGDGTKITVRMIGINTPETVDPRRAVECFGKEASKYLYGLLDGREDVYLETDRSQDQTDRYGRVLAYVTLGGPAGGTVASAAIDSVTVNEEMIRGGYAHEYTYDMPYRLQTIFKKSEREARENERGLWDPKVCAVR